MNFNQRKESNYRAYVSDLEAPGSRGVIKVALASWLRVFRLRPGNSAQPAPSEGLHRTPESTFEDIRIVALEDARTRRNDPVTFLRDVSLRLSAQAPLLWASMFNDAWSGSFFHRKREASVLGKFINVFCGPDELEKEIVPALQKVIRMTNRNYRRALMGQAVRDAKKVTTDAWDRERLETLKKRIKFD